MSSTHFQSDGLVVPLDHRAPVSHIGGKARNLALLAAADLPTPRSIVVTSRAWTLFVGQLQSLGPPARQLEPDEAQSMRATGAWFRKRLAEAEIPPEVRAALHSLQSEVLGDSPVSVRSSAIAEDSGVASFAGQFKTSLNVLDPESTATAVRSCWLHGVSDQVIGYQIRMNIHEIPLPMAVLVQEMLRPIAAGVLFSRNPVTGNTDNMLLSSSWGLGTSVVDGSVRSDNFVLSRVGGRITAADIGDKAEREDVHAGGGLARTVVAEEKRLQPSITEPQIAEIWRLGLEAEQVLGGAADIEWAVVPDGTVMLLQARPITT